MDTDETDRMEAAEADRSEEAEADRIEEAEAVEAVEAATGATPETQECDECGSDRPLISYSGPDDCDENDENEEREHENEEEERHTTLSEFLDEDLDARQGLDERACASYLARIARALEDLSMDVRAIRNEQYKRETIEAHRCGDGVVFVASATTHKYRDSIVGAGGLWRLTRTKAAGQTLGYLLTPETADAAAAQLARVGVSVEWQ